VVLHYLRHSGWLETHGAIIFSQYRATAEWIAEALCGVFPDEPVALYAGGSASFVQRGSDRRSAGREQIKASIERGDIRLVCATARPLGIFPNGSSGQDRQWSFVTFEMLPTIGGSIGNIRNAFSHPVISMNGCGKAGS